MHNRVQHHLKRAESLPIILESSLEPTKKIKKLYWLHVDIYGSHAMKFLEDRNINLQCHLVSRYDRCENDHIDIVAEVASHLVLECEKEGGGWLYELYLQLLQSRHQVTQLAAIGDKNNHAKNSLYLQNLKQQGIVLAKEMARVKQLKDFSINEKQKMVKSLVYAIAALQDPFNKVLAQKLANNASQTIGSERKLKQFYRALVVLSGLITIFLGMPFTFGLSVPMIYFGGMSCLAGSAAFFYHRECSVAKDMRGLSNVMKSMPQA